MSVFRSRNYTDEELGYPTEAFGRIPSFANREEEAEFWDTHDTTEFVGVELHPTEVTLGGELAERLTIRLDQNDRAELSRRARYRGRPVDTGPDVGQGTVQPWHNRILIPVDMTD